MTRIKCRLICHSPGAHIQQVYTGLSMLHRSGLVELSQEIVPALAHRIECPQHLRDAIATHARVVVDDSMVVHYDMHDAYEIDRRDLDTCDHYFKRSYASEYVREMGRSADKVAPFGLNYHVLPNFADLFGARRALRLPRGARNRVHALRESLDARNRFKFYPRVRDIEAQPADEAPPRVLFLAAAYDPRDNPDRSASKIDERERVNETRASCIRLLRKELGPRFLGGFSHNEFSRRHYKDCLVADNEVTDKRNYLRALRSHSICVSTIGLHGSIGWKLAEYIACARAVLLERPVCDLPADLQPGLNYLQFADPTECVELALKLLADQPLRERMMASNAHYYDAHLRPDALLLDSLKTVLSKRRSPISRPDPSAIAPDTSRSRS